MRSLDFALLAIFVIIPLVAAALVHLSRRQKRRADAVAGELSAAALRASVLLDLGARSVSGGSIEAICHDAVTMTTTALAVDYCAIFTVSREGDSLLLAFAAGWDMGDVDGLLISTDIDTQAGYALHAHDPVVVDNASSDKRFILPQVL